MKLANDDMAQAERDLAETACKMVEIQCRKIGSTDKSWHVYYKGTQGFIPKDEVEKMGMVGDQMTVTIPDWILEKNFDG